MCPDFIFIVLHQSDLCLFRRFWQFFCSEVGILPEILRKTVVLAVSFFGVVGITVAIIEAKIILEKMQETIACYGWGVPFLLLSFITFIFAVKEPVHCEKECIVHK